MYIIYMLNVGSKSKMTNQCEYGSLLEVHNSGITTIIFAVSAGPALIMTLGSATFFFFLSLSGSNDAATALLPKFQNFSAGLLIAAIGTELFPLLKCGAPAGHGELDDTSSSIGLVIGFLTGLIFMFGIKYFLEDLEDEEDDELEEEEETQIDEAFGWSYQSDDQKQAEKMNSIQQQQFRTNALKPITQATETLCQAISKSRINVDEAMHNLEFHMDVAMTYLKGRPPLTTWERKDLTHKIDYIKEKEKKLNLLIEGGSRYEIIAAIKELEELLGRIHSISHGKNAVRSRWDRTLLSALADNKGQVARPEVDHVPWTQFASTSIDAAVDGLLIGLTLSADSTAGLAMAIATSIEMGFLGLQFSASVHKSVKSLALHALVCFIPPAVLFFSSIAGAIGGRILIQDQALFIGFIAFALVALLFMVTQDLLAEAHSADNSMVTNSMLFVGILGGIMLDKVL